MRKLKMQLNGESDFELLPEMRKLFRLKLLTEDIDLGLYRETVGVLTSMFDDEKWIRQMYRYYLPRMGKKKISPLFRRV